MYCKKVTALLLSLSLTAGLCACGQKSLRAEIEETTSAVADAEEKAYIEETLNLANNTDLTWTYNTDADAWVMSIVSAVVYPELPDQQGVSACIPGAYVTGIDTDGDNSADVTSREAGEKPSAAPWLSIMRPRLPVPTAKPTPQLLPLSSSTLVRLDTAPR
ncbi:hypothetical protein [Flavonifractor sp. An306]|uniref:hypothetical protein n=1 Tax=Flavonifractor sp. An306 TaxID=1965629 RepID=UPI000B370CE9|nr:hypothetical protein [Flavonifractor sp. An306]OUO42816.1 hypothetical protein B5F88_03845 [Flavonifractor sp. An306]